jgi:hypothetical protein
MPWPPQEGQLLPRCHEPVGIERRLRTYSLKLDHKHGGPKAKGFSKMLGIDLAAIDYLEQEIRTGIALIPISKVRLKEPGAAACTVEFRIAGLGRYSRRTALLRTGWQVNGPDARPLMTTAYLRDKERR